MNSELIQINLFRFTGIFGGFWWRLFYDIFFGICTLTALWSYVTLFGVSLARSFGISSISTACNMESSSGTSSCRGLYTLYVCLFYIWSLFASLMGLKHQKILL